MKLSKKLLAGALATSMLATGSTAFAAVDYGNGLTQVGDTGVYTGTGISTSTTVGDPAKHAVTGTATFKDDISVEITWGALTYSFTRTWNTGTSDWNAAVWETTEGSGKISAKNNSAQDYDVELAFAHTEFSDYSTARNYNNVTGKFYQTEVLNEANLAGNTEQATLALGGKGGTAASYLWLSGNPENAEGKSVAGKYGFDAGGTTATNSEVFGTVTATLANHAGA